MHFNTFPETGTLLLLELETKNWNETLCAVVESTTVQTSVYRNSLYLLYDLYN